MRRDADIADTREAGVRVLAGIGVSRYHDGRRRVPITSMSPRAPADVRPRQAGFVRGSCALTERDLQAPNSEHWADPTPFPFMLVTFGNTRRR